MDKVLLIEDSKSCQVLVRRALENVVELSVANNIAEATSAVHEAHFDLLLVDISLPDGDGIGFCSQLLSEAKTKPRILFLTGKNDLSTKLTSFSVGADDYIVKPVEPLELKARVLSQLRNLHEATQAARTIEVGNLKMDLGTHTAEIQTEEGKKELEFTPTEFKLLAQMAEQVGQIYSRDQLLIALFDGKVHVFDRTIDTHLSRMRKKLTKCTHTITPVYGIGYKFVKKAA